MLVQPAGQSWLSLEPVYTLFSNSDIKYVTLSRRHEWVCESSTLYVKIFDKVELDRDKKCGLLPFNYWQVLKMCNEVILFIIVQILLISGW